jgi:hypothetical protein
MNHRLAFRAEAVSKTTERELPLAPRVVGLVLKLVVMPQLRAFGSLEEVLAKQEALALALAQVRARPHVQVQVVGLVQEQVLLPSSVGSGGLALEEL